MNKQLNRYVILFFILTSSSFIMLVGIDSESKAVYRPVQIAFPTPQWVTTTALPKGLARHTAVAYDGKIYVIGGTGDKVDDLSSFVYTATLETGNGIKSWSNYPPGKLPSVAYQAAVSDDEGCIYITGGYNKNPLPSTYFGAPDDNGRIAWSGPALQEFLPRYLHASVISDGRIFVLGGWNGGKMPPILADDIYAQVSHHCDGLNSDWKPANSASLPRAAHAAVAFEGRIYVIGGLKWTDGEDWIETNSVHVATVVDTGLTPWTPLTCTLPISLAYHSAVLSPVERKIYVIGGRTDTKDISNHVFSAYILSDGTLTGSQDNPAWWQEERGLSRDPKLKLYRHSAVHGGNGSIYVIGGQDANDKSLNSVLYTLPLDLDKSRDPADPLHEGDTITYTISYTNTSLITQTIAITDILPYNLTLISETVTLPPTRRQGFALVWDLGGVGPGDSGEISFQMQVPLLPGGRLVSATGPPPPEQPAPSQVLPVPIACDTTRFWAAGVTRQLVEDSPYTLQVSIPPGSSPTTMWLAVKEARDINLMVGDQRAERIATSTREIGASLWSAPVTTQAIQSGQVSVISNSPRRLNALFLFEGDKPVFDTSAFYDVNKGSCTTTYTLDIPSVQTQTMDVILPFMDITYWQDVPPPQLDTRMTTVTVQLEGRPPQRAIANDPNIGNGLLMTQFPLDIGPLSHVVTATKQLTITVDTQDSIYTLGPRICRPVYVENTAWLCSKETGCISAWVDNPPEHFAPPSVYLPIIFKSYSP